MLSELLLFVFWLPLIENNEFVKQLCVCRKQWPKQQRIEIETYPLISYTTPFAISDTLSRAVGVLPEKAIKLLLQPLALG